MSRFVNQLSGRTGAFQLTEAAVNDERNVAIFQPSAHIGCCATAVEGVVDDRGGEPRTLALNRRILKSARDDDACPGFLEAVCNVEGDDRFVLNDKHQAPVKLCHD